MSSQDPYIIDVPLVQETGIPEIDKVLRCLVNVLYVGVGPSLRSIFLIGSYTDGSYVADSDLDCCLLWKDEADADSRRRGASFVTHLRQTLHPTIDPMYDGSETPFYDSSIFCDDIFGMNDPCGPILKSAVKQRSLLLWGDDIRPRIAESGNEEMVKDVVTPAVNWIKQAHYGSLDAKISYPLSDPSPDKEDLGYGDLQRVTYFVIHIARSLIYLKSGEFVCSKSEVADRFEASVGGEWNRLVRQVCNARYGALSDEEAREVHLSACHQLTAFQNFLLSDEQVGSVAETGH